MNKITNSAAMIAASSLLIASPVICAGKQEIVDIKDVSSYKKDGHSRSLFFINMGAFSSESYATRYKTHLSSKTKHPVKVERSQDDKNIFYVLVGPFNSVAKLVQSGSDITGKKSSSTAIKKNNNPVVKSHSLKLRPIFTMPNKSNKQTQINKNTTTSKKTHVTNNRIKGHSKHHQIFASQSDYPIKQRPKTDAKGNVIPLFKTGPYVGASFGFQDNTGKAPATAAYQAVSGTLSAGAGQMFTRRFYLAGEFFGGDNVKAKTFGPGVNGYLVDSAWNYGGDIIPGYMITDTVLAYLRIGVIRNQFLTKPDAKISQYPAGSQYSRRMTRVKNGWQIGAGTQTNLYKNLDARAEYIFSYFHGIYNNNTKSDINQVNLGLVYKFTDSLHN